jgi:hypothetical protein
MLIATHINATRSPLPINIAFDFRIIALRRAPNGTVFSRPPQTIRTTFQFRILNIDA